MPFFLKLDGLNGGSEVPGYKGQIVINSARLSISRSFSTGTDGHNQFGGSSYQSPVSFQLVGGTHSPVVFNAVKTGQIFKTGTITLTETVKEKEKPYLVMIMKNVRIMSCAVGGSGSGLGERIVVEYESMSMETWGSDGLKTTGSLKREINVLQHTAAAA